MMIYKERCPTVKIWIILILFLISTSSANPVIPILSLDNDGLYSIAQIELSNSYFKGEPSYNIEVQASNSHVNRDDNYSMKIFISGVGDALFGKIRVNIPNYIVKDKSVILRSFSYNYSYDRINNTITILKPLSSSEPQGTALDLNIPNIYFNLKDINGFVNWGEVTTIEGEVPYTISFTISPNAPGGDHDIYLILFYKFGDKWYTSSQVVSLHINRWYEKDWMQGFVFLSLLAALAAFFLQIISLIQGYRNLKRRDEKR